MTIIVCGDQDVAGQKMFDDINDKCSLTYRTFKIPLNSDKNDLGDMNDDEITSDIKPWIDEITRLHSMVYN